jgi:hypothetical protein
MAKGRSRGPTRLDKRREAEAVEAKEAQEHEETQEEVEEEAEEEAEPDAEPDAEVEADSEDGDGEGVKKKKKPAKKKAAKKAPAAKKPATKRSRAAKEVRRKAVWIVYDNASKKIETFPFNQKADAEALLAKKIEEKKGTFYLNLVKEPIED